MRARRPRVRRSLALPFENRIAKIAIMHEVNRSSGAILASLMANTGAAAHVGPSVRADLRSRGGWPKLAAPLERTPERRIAARAAQGDVSRSDLDEARLRLLLDGAVPHRVRERTHRRKADGDDGLRVVSAL